MPKTRAGTVRGQTEPQEPPMVSNQKPQKKRKADFQVDPSQYTGLTGLVAKNVAEVQRKKAEREAVQDQKKLDEDWTDWELLHPGKDPLEEVPNAVAMGWRPYSERHGSVWSSAMEAEAVRLFQTDPNRFDPPITGNEPSAKHLALMFDKVRRTKKKLTLPFFCHFVMAIFFFYIITNFIPITNSYYQAHVSSSVFQRSVQAYELYRKDKINGEHPDRRFFQYESIVRVLHVSKLTQARGRKLREWQMKFVTDILQSRIQVRLIQEETFTKSAVSHYEYCSVFFFFFFSPEVFSQDRQADRNEDCRGSDTKFLVAVPVCSRLRCS